MAISVNADPTGGLEVLGNVVPHLLRARPSSDRVVGGGSGPKASPALSVYTLGLSDAAKENALASVKFVGWRYLIDDNGSPAVAEIRPTGSGSAPKFSRLTRGSAASGLKKAAEAASIAYGSSGDTYEARILEVPALHSICLWLHGRNDVFFEYLKPDGQVPDSIIEEHFYLSSIAKDARQKQTLIETMPSGIPDLM